MPRQVLFSGSVSRHFWPVGLVVLALALLSPSPAAAQTDPEVRAYFLSINALYESLEYESALAQVNRARAVTRTPADKATLSLYEGAILADMNRWDESVAAFRIALLAQPDAKLPVKVSPKVAQRFEQVRESVKQEQLAAQPKPPPPPAPAPKPAPQVVQTEPTSPPASPPAIASVDASPSVSRRSFSRPQVLVPAIGGGVLMVLGGVSWALSRGELSSLNNNDPKLITREDAHQVASRGKTFQTMGIGLLGAGVAGVGFALGWHAFGPSPQKTALTVGTDGTSAFVQGRWP